MKFRLKIKKINPRSVILYLLALAGLAALYTYRLGSLTGGRISERELQVANTPIGWHGLYKEPMFAALTFLRSIVFYLVPDFDASLLRLTNVIFGLITIVAFYYVVKAWHNTRTALIASLLFACSALVLHVSRVATNDVVYLSALPLLLFGYLLLRKYPLSKWPFTFNILIWAMLLYTPGMVWFVLISIYTQKTYMMHAFKNLGIAPKIIYSLIVVKILGLLGYLIYLRGDLMKWLGLPEHFAAPVVILKQFVGVFVHLFIRGPQYPDIWLGKSPIMDVFCWSMALIGISFYARNRKATRTKAMFCYSVTGLILITLGGPVSIALLVPLLYLLAATGVTYILQDWFKVFPDNPIARSLAVMLIGVAVILSCVYNLRSYFVAWPHNNDTHTAFSYRR